MDRVSDIIVMFIESVVHWHLDQWCIDSCGHCEVMVACTRCQSTLVIHDTPSVVCSALFSDQRVCEDCTHKHVEWN